MKRVVVIGAGSAGLAAARHLVSRPNEFEVCVYEQAAQIGGTWVYTDDVGQDEFGLPVHSSMYKSLRTNLPKEVMGYPDYPIPQNPKSYLPAADILRFLENYAQHFGVLKHIKFRHHVRNVRPLTDGEHEGWEVEVTDLLSGRTTISRFDAVMVCNGHYNTPYVPKIEGIEHFRGHKLHSHDYREPQPFLGKHVLVIGAGPSGMDLALEISSCAKKVILSHHLREPIKTVFPSNVQFATDVAQFTEDEAIFKDGTKDKIDVIFYCTGYCYNFPFLSDECGVQVKNNYVSPLFKHLIHIDRPTMCFVGLPFYVCAFSMFDLQSRLFLKVLDGSLKLPSQEMMRADEARERARRRDHGLGPRQGHMMGTMQGDYYEELAQFGHVTPLPPVLAKLHNESSARFLDDLCHYRDDVYRIIDDHTFEQIV